MAAHVRLEICDDEPTGIARKKFLDAKGYDTVGPVKTTAAYIKSFGYDDPGDDPKLKSFQMVIKDADGELWIVFGQAK
ncbi:MAG TPA: hypothetical protein VNH64_07315 [Parvularculaceae bacterium]|nr:hypothetical protein [Parvularculaceae bacterium]